MKRFILLPVSCILFSVFCLLVTPTLAYYAPKSARVDKTRTPIRQLMDTSTKSQVSDKPADFWWIWWTGIGNFAGYTVSNTLQGGHFGNPHVCGDYFDATNEQWVCAYKGGNDTYRGHTGEYPAGSRQPYVYSAGVWIGALYPVSFDSITGEPTKWQRRVSKGAYNSDMGGMAIPELEDAGEVGDVSYPGLAFSTQIIPWNHGYEHEGECVFTQPGVSQENYQTLWHFADTLINSRRDDSTTHIHPDSGDILSGEDTYAVAGDWIPSQDASAIWTRDAGPYDVHPLGIRVEQRTYSWNYDYNNAYIYLNWKIRNMNSFPLDSIYVGYFMDNDIGHGMDGSQGCEDDLIGFDTSTVEVLPDIFRKLDLGYTYDSDGYENNWTTPAGFVGCVLCETPDNKGLTGFQYWTRVGEFGLLIDKDKQDSLKYEALAYREERFIVAGTPDDMRQLSCSGPYIKLLPGEEIDFTIAIVVAYTFDELKDRAINALKQFELGYLGYEPPPSPELSAIPGDNKVYLSWDGTRSESYVDEMAKQPTFEGYTVYRSKTGLAGKWDTLATFDLESSTYETVITKYTKGTSKAEISFGGLDTIYPGIETKTYKIVFTSGHEFVLWDNTDNKKLFYNISARTSGEGYCVMDNMYGSAYPTDPGYVSDAFIYIQGFYIKIKNGEVIPDQPGVNLAPCVEDEFMIWSYGKEEIGREHGIEHYYIDEDVTNGMKYYYTVTAFSRPIPELGVGSLESGKSGTRYWAIPCKKAVDWVEPTVKVTKKSGMGTANIVVDIIDESKVTNHKYTLQFIAGGDTMAYYLPDTAYLAGSWRVIDDSTGEIVVDSVPYMTGDSSAPIMDGLLIQVNGQKESIIDTAGSDSFKVVGDNTNMYIEGELPVGKVLLPYDYKIEFFDDWASADSTTDLNGYECYFKVTNTASDTPALFKFNERRGLVNHQFDWKSEAIYIYDEAGIVKRITFKANYYDVPDDSIIPPEEGDEYIFKTIKITNTLDEFTIEPSSPYTQKSSYSLDSLRVVPNPYYLRANWDHSDFRQKVWFQGLPSKCTIRIFNIAGLLIKTIEHDEPEIKSMKGRTEMSGTGAHAWDLCSEAGKERTGLKVASGLYIYQVTAKTTDGKSIQKVGKFAIIR